MKFKHDVQVQSIAKRLRTNSKSKASGAAISHNRGEMFHAGVGTPMVWWGKTFRCPSEVAEAIDRICATVQLTWTKYGNIDGLWPGEDSDYYYAPFQRDDCSFIPPAIEKYGVKAVARALRSEPNNIRKERYRGVLWRHHWPIITRKPRLGEHISAARYYVRDEDKFLEELQNPPSRPYVYMLGWTKKKRYYIGSRTAVYCEPDDLLSTYFSSSPAVINALEKYGDPDCVLTREYTTKQEAAFAERLLLGWMSVSPPERQEMYLNQIYICNLSSAREFLWQRADAQRANRNAYDRGKVARLIGERYCNKKRLNPPIIIGGEKYYGIGAVAKKFNKSTRYIAALINANKIEHLLTGEPNLKFNRAEWKEAGKLKPWMMKYKPIKFNGKLFSGFSEIAEAYNTTESTVRNLFDRGQLHFLLGNKDEFYVPNVVPVPINASNKYFKG